MMLKRLIKITLILVLSFFTLSGMIGWAMAAISLFPLYWTHGYTKQWPPPSPFSPRDGVVIEKVILEKSDPDNFHGDGSTVKLYQVVTEEKVEAILSNDRIRDGYIWLSQPFDEKTTSALRFLSRWTSGTEATTYINQLIASDDLRVSYVYLEPGTDASLWLFSPKLGLLAYIRVNT